MSLQSSLIRRCAMPTTDTVFLPESLTNSSTKLCSKDLALADAEGNSRTVYYEGEKIGTVTLKNGCWFCTANNGGSLDGFVDLAHAVNNLLIFHVNNWAIDYTKLHTIFFRQ